MKKIKKRRRKSWRRPGIGYCRERREINKSDSKQEMTRENRERGDEARRERSEGEREGGGEGGVKEDGKGDTERKGNGEWDGGRERD